MKFFIFLSLLLAHANPKLEPAILRLSLEQEPTSLDWNAGRSASDRFLASFLMRGLMKYDVGARPVCDLCTSYSVSADGKVYKFILPQDLKWSDGKPLKAVHFLDSFTRLLSTKNHFPLMQEFTMIEKTKEGTPSIKTLGDHELEFTLYHPSSHFLHLMTLTAVYPIRKELAGKSNQPVLGPYTLAAWEKGKRIVLEGNPEYKADRPVYRVELWMDQHSGLVKKFQSGKLDILSQPTTEEILANSKAKLQTNPYWAVRLLYLNTKKNPLSDLSLRKALLYSLDRENLPPFTRNGERQVSGLLPPGILGHRAVPFVHQDLKLAQAERHRALAWPQIVELEMIYSNQSIEQRYVEWLTDRFQKINVRLKTRAYPLDQYYKALESGRFDLALHVWAFRTANPIDLLQRFTSTTNDNWSHWVSLPYDTIYQKLQKELSTDPYLGLIEQLTQILEVQEVAAIPLGYPTQTFLLGRRVSSFEMTPFGEPNLVKIHVNN